MKRIAVMLTALSVSIGLFACSAPNNGYFSEYFNAAMPDAQDGNYRYDEIEEIGFSEVAKNPDSYFSLDKNTACYSLVRRQIMEGESRISPDSVRIEEMINYFDYDYPAPEGDETMKLSYAMSSCPWNEDSVLLAVGLKSKEYDLGDVRSNFVFLIDTSGSMDGDDRMGLVKEGISAMADHLTQNDCISIVTYSGSAKVVLDGVSGAEHSEIKKAVGALDAYGATAGGQGLERAYKIAWKHFIKGGNNRVILVSDGDFNVGPSEPEELKQYITRWRKSGVYLSALGVGMGNTRDDMMEFLARNGNGNYAYLDTLAEAKKVLIDDMSGTLLTVAMNAKAHLSFTQNVQRYRLIGYDTKHISAEDFDNPYADTGEIGSGLCVTALYELQLNSASGSLGSAVIRYDDVSAQDPEARELNMEIDASALDGAPSEDMIFISCVAEFGLVLRESEYRGDADIGNVLARLSDSSLENYLAADQFKTEFKALVAKAKRDLAALQ